MQLYWAFNVHFGTSYAAFLKSREERAEVLSICPEPKDMPDLPDPRQDISRHMETWERVDCDLAFFHITAITTSIKCLSMPPTRSLQASKNLAMLLKEFQRRSGDLAAESKALYFQVQALCFQVQALYFQPARDAASRTRRCQIRVRRRLNPRLKPLGQNPRLPSGSRTHARTHTQVPKAPLSVLIHA